MLLRLPFSLLVGGGFAVAGSLASAAEVFPADQIEFFEKSIRPLLADRCYDCHGSHRHENGLRLDLRTAILKGSDYGKVVEPGKPDASKLIKAIKHAPGVEAMPKKSDPLKAEEIALLEKWVQMGLPWPEEKAVAEGHSKADPKEHWAFLPVVKPAVPAEAKATNPVDAFVGTKLKAAGLDFAPQADPATLCRRLYLTLTGLQPTFEEIETFKKACQTNVQSAVDGLVTQLLSSPHYGERWGRYWLDVARYSDTEGYTAGGRDNRFPHAYTFRNWVIQALNEDMPYDQFVTNQLAADKLLPAEELVRVSKNTDSAPVSAERTKQIENLAALGFLTVNDRFLGDRLLQNDDRIDVISRGLIGLTVSCARCHDHKFDPIPSKDYYAFYSILASSDMAEDGAKPIIGQPSDAQAVAAFRTEVGKVEERMNAFRKEVFAETRNLENMKQYLLFAKKHMDSEDSAFRGAAGHEKMRDRLADKWRKFLKAFAYVDKPHPALVAWKEFSALSDKDFEAKAAEVLAKVTTAPGNGEVIAAFKSKPVPKSFADVAATYAEVFSKHIELEPFADAQKESIRKLMQNGQSPMSVDVMGVGNFFTRNDQDKMTKMENEVKKLELTSPGAPLRAMAMLDRPKPSDVRVMIRGNPGRPGEPAPRAYLTFFGGQKFTDGSGRLELAQKIASKENPLTARVLVNRVWMQHFGKPLVSQTSDFGVQTPKPEQAALLDYLAATFMEQGWSMKKLHRAVLTSQTYLQSCESTEQKDLKDAENNLLGRMNRQRMDYEAMRDSLLEVTGSLNAAKAGGRSVPLNAGDVDSWRSVYLLVDRYEQARVPATFDFANPDAHSPQRFVTTVPQQTLFLMNSPFMRQQATQLSTKLPVAGSTPDSKTIEALYQRVLLRKPKVDEMELAQRFLTDATELQSTPVVSWRYGTVRLQKEGEGKVALNEWKPFSVLTTKGSQKVWSHTGKVPDPVWGYAMWQPTGGHAGSGGIAPTLRWEAPFDGVISIKGVLKRDAVRGDGVRGWIVNSRTGVVKNALALPTAKEQAMNVNALEVQKGDVLSFVIDCEGNTDSDSFTWIPEIHRVEADGQTRLLTNAKNDFCGKDGWPLGRPRPQSPLAQLTQVLLMSNEFQFVD